MTPPFHRLDSADSGLRHRLAHDETFRAVGRAKFPRATAAAWLTRLRTSSKTACAGSIPAGGTPGCRSRTGAVAFPACSVQELERVDGGVVERQRPPFG